MSSETRVTQVDLDPSQVLMVQGSGTARMALPLGGKQIDCLVLLYRGVRTALGPSASGERAAVAVPDENIRDVVASLVSGARAWFPDVAAGLQLVDAASTDTGVSGRGGPWIKLSHCGVGMFGADGVVTHACCPSMVCKDMVALVGGGVFAEHTSNPELGGSGGVCDWSGVGVVDDRADWMAPVDDSGGRRFPRPWRRR